MTFPQLPLLPYGRHLIEQDDIDAVTRVLRSDWLTGGPPVEEFERAFAERVGSRYAVSCSSGTAGLHMAAIALDLGPGDAVIVPTLTFLATANAARFVGAEVVFADVDPETGLMRAADMDVALHEAARRGWRVRAVFPVHFAGQAVSLSELRCALGPESSIAIVEDAAHAVGTRTLKGNVLHHVGDCADSAMAVFSLHPVKTIAMGEGGVVATNDDALDGRLRLARNHGMTRDAAVFRNRAQGFSANGEANPWYYEMHELGFNYRASAIHCALGLSQLKRLDCFTERRSFLAARYDRLIAALSPVVRPVGRRADCLPAWHLYVVRVDFAALGIERAEVMRRLAQRGIGSQVHYLPLHLQPYYAERYGHRSLPGSETFYAQELSLPLFPGMSDDDVERVVDALAGIVRSASRGAGQ